jgi:hypothetical protein
MAEYEEDTRALRVGAVLSAGGCAGRGQPRRVVHAPSARRGHSELRQVSRPTDDSSARHRLTCARALAPSPVSCRTNGLFACVFVCVFVCLPASRRTRSRRRSSGARKRWSLCWTRSARRPHPPAPPPPALSPASSVQQPALSAWLKTPTAAIACGVCLRAHAAARPRAGDTRARVARALPAGAAAANASVSLACMLCVCNTEHLLHFMLATFTHTQYIHMRSASCDDRAALGYPRHRSLPPRTQSTAVIPCSGRAQPARRANGDLLLRVLGAAVRPPARLRAPCAPRAVR